MRESYRIPPSVAAAASAAALCVLPSAAIADGSLPVMVSAGVAFSVSFGQQIEVGVNLDLRLIGLLLNPDDNCSREGLPRAGLGPYGQAGWYHKTGWRFGAGIHGGGEIVNHTYGLEGELGWSYRRAVPGIPSTQLNDPTKAVGPAGAPPPVLLLPGSHGLHFGILGQVMLPPLKVLGVQLPLGLDIPLSESSRGSVFATSLGFRAPSIFGFPGGSCLIAGRPLRADGEIVLPPVLATGPYPRRELDDSLSAALGEAWLQDARTECASVPAFYALARDLALVGAPQQLIADALAAAEDEIRHTQLCSQLASSFLGVTVAPIVPPVPAAIDADPQAALCRLAIESWSDGCLGEGSAAARAAAALRCTTDRAARRTLIRIAQDEARHAELGWAVLDFCLQAGGPRIRDAVAARVFSRDEEAPCFERGADADPTLLQAHGRLSASESESVQYQTAVHAHARAPLVLDAS